ncbi:hypothetical protein C8Q72DRAFT_810632 [Fomitopsis betulina]|nr:hypothetical protein C8Q72DRAFT_810632 [Fomitopsis betulina]
MLPHSADRNNGMSSLTAQTAADIVKDTRDRLDNLGDSLAEQITQIAQLDEQLDTAETLNRLNKLMDAQDERLEKEVAEVRALQTQVLEKDVVEYLRSTIEKNVSDLVDQIVRDEVKNLLHEHIKPELINELESHKRELAEVERDLHNSESRRKNAQIRTSQLDAELAIILRHDGTKSPHYPRDLQSLLGMDGKTTKALMHDYCPQVVNASESQDRRLNCLMRHFGISYQLVPTGGGSSVLAKVTAPKILRLS